MTQNVVTYTVEIITDNSSGKLLPYLTANVTFIVGERKDVLLVPNAALRWTPQVSQVVAEFRGSPKKAPGAEAPAQVKPAGQGRQGGASPRRRLCPPGNPGASGLRHPRPERRQPDAGGEQRA